MKIKTGSKWVDKKQPERYRGEVVEYPDLPKGWVALRLEGYKTIQTMPEELLCNWFREVKDYPAS